MPDTRNRRLRVMLIYTVVVVAGFAYVLIASPETKAGEAFITIGIPSWTALIAAYLGFASYENVKLESTDDRM